MKEVSQREKDQALVNQVNEYRREYDASLTKSCKDLGIKPSAYGNAKARLKKSIIASTSPTPPEESSVVLPKGQQEAWDKVERYKKENPGTSAYMAIKTLGVTGSTYHNAKNKMEGKIPVKRKATMQTLVVPEHPLPTDAPSRVVCLIIPSSEIGNVLKQIGI